jgi:hypothetical protein
MKKLFVIIAALHSGVSFPQSDFQKVINAGGLILTGISIIRGQKAEIPKQEQQPETPYLSELCFKNKLEEKITIRLTGKDQEGNVLTREVIVLRDGKECLYEIAKGVWDYEIVTGEDSVYRKGQYRLRDQTVITIR